MIVETKGYVLESNFKPWLDQHLFWYLGDKYRKAKIIRGSFGLGQQYKYLVRIYEAVGYSETVGSETWMTEEEIAKTYWLIVHVKNYNRIWNQLNG